MGRAPTTRRRPRRRDSRETVEVILEATRRLLVAGGLRKTTTNAIAKKAGVSVGSIYQYFGNKEAIVRQLATRQFESALERATSAGTDGDEGSLTAAVRRFVGVLASVEQGDPRLRRVLLLEVPRVWIQQTTAKVHAGVRGAVARSLSEITPNESEPVLERRAFVLTHAVQGVIDAALIERDEPLDQELVEELVRLVSSYVAATTTTA